MRNRFNEMLEELNVELIKMGALCEAAISNAIQAIMEDESFYEKVLAVEEEIDLKETEIEQQCMRLLLMQQPVASDLREVSSALKMISDMERIGDQACNIAEMAKYIVKSHSHLEHLAKMAESTRKMVTESIDSFVKKDLELARKVMDYDDVVDDLFATIKREVVEVIGSQASDSESFIDILMAAKYFERIADHATNIVEWVAYSITGIHEKCQ